MSQLQVKVGQSVQIPSHPSIYLLWVTVMRQVLMIRQNNHFVWRSYEEVSVVL